MDHVAGMVCYFGLHSLRFIQQSSTTPYIDQDGKFLSSNCYFPLILDSADGSGPAAWTFPESLSNGKCHTYFLQFIRAMVHSVQRKQISCSETCGLIRV